jgi:molybdenum cofactor cytidylyltransferase
MTDTAVVLLAAGLSRRYGAVGKLVANYRGKPLALHIADTLNGMSFARRVAVCRSGDEDLAQLLRDRDFAVVLNPDTARGMASSLALGIEAVDAADAAMICLADMPNVTIGHLHACLDLSRTADIVASAVEGGAPTPPAVFHRRHFPELLALEGDKGARSLLGHARLVTAPAAELADFDTPGDFANA